MSYLYFFLASLVEAYYFYKSCSAKKDEVIAYTILSICSLPFIPIIAFCLVTNDTFKGMYEECIKPYWFELLVYIGLLINAIILW